LTPSDFSLFDDIKDCLKGVFLNSEEEIFLEIHEILRKISSDALLAEFEDWMKRLV
jgi:hypothetical protein